MFDIELNYITQPLLLLMAMEISRKGTLTSELGANQESCFLDEKQNLERGETSQKKASLWKLCM